MPLCDAICEVGGKTLISLGKTKKGPVGPLVVSTFHVGFANGLSAPDSLPSKAISVAREDAKVQRLGMGHMGDLVTGPAVKRVLFGIGLVSGKKVFHCISPGKAGDIPAGPSAPDGLTCDLVGIFGEPGARVVTLVRRSKKRPAAGAAGCTGASTIAGCIAFATSRAAARVE